MFEDLYNSKNISEYLEINRDFIFSFTNASYSQLSKEKDSIDSVVLDRYNEIRKLDFTKTANRSFLFLLYDLCERLELHSAMQLLWHLFVSNRIETGSRFLAANLFSFNVAEAPQYLNRFDEICNKLTVALENEEDNDKKILSTFANYYLVVLGIHETWIEQLKIKILENLSKYHFLASAFISDLLSYDTKIYLECKGKIETLKDKLFDRIGNAAKFIPVSNTSELSNIEVGNYANEISRISDITFEKLRQIAIKNTSYDSKLDDRGVAQLSTEQEMFIYLKNYGKMHKAKLDCCFSEFPFDEIGGNVNVIDWGCGQGLATFVFKEFLNNSSINLNIEKITLIEPSLVCIKRAFLHIRLLFNNNIETVCKEFNEINANDLSSSADNIRIHLFSNVLDLDEDFFSQQKLINLIKQSQCGRNYFICVSPYITDYKRYRLENFVSAFSDSNDFKEILSIDSRKGDWDNTNWSRVLRVFKSNITC